MSERTYHPRRGDIVHVNFSPSAGRELAERHYAVVLSQTSYNRRTGYALVCGITSRARGSPFEVELPAGLLPVKKGVGAVTSVALADGVRQIDYRERECAFVVGAPRAVVEDVIDKLFSAIEDEDE